jgi:prevent-host-death family protein
MSSLTLSLSFRSVYYTCVHYLFRRRMLVRRIGARELKQHTGEVIARGRRGERVLLTFRGAPVAVISPISAASIEEATEREVEKVSEESLAWLGASESAFGFWDNEEDEG